MSENKIRTWVKGVVAAFLCATAAASFALAGSRTTAPSAPEPQSASRYVPPGMHEANAGLDVGPGSDEAQAAGSPSAE